MYNYDEIENISDQLGAYAAEAAEAILKISKQYDLTYEQAAAAVEIAALSQRNDVMQRVYRSIDRLADRMRDDDPVMMIHTCCDWSGN